MNRRKHKPRMPGLRLPSNYAKSRSFTRRDGSPLTQALKEVLDPTKAPSKVVRLKDMSPEKRAELERLYSRRKS